MLVAFFFSACFILHVLPRASAFSHGAPDYSCRDPSTFHTRKVNDTHEGIIMPQTMETSPFHIDVNSRTFAPGERITVTLYTDNPRQPLRGFFMQAIQDGIHIRDLRRRAFGYFRNITANERPSVCQSSGSVLTGGATHTNNRDRERVRVVWVAPEAYSPGPIQFIATGVFNYDTYWTNVRSPSLTPTGYQTNNDTRLQERLTPTAAWYRWLQYIRQRQMTQQSSNRRGDNNQRRTMGGATENDVNSVSNRIASVSTRDLRSRPANELRGAQQHVVNNKIPSERTSDTQNSNRRPASRRATSRDSAHQPINRHLRISDHSHPDHDHAVHHG